jgi:hypothetical protein
MIVLIYGYGDGCGEKKLEYVGFIYKLYIIFKRIFLSAGEYDD